MPSLTLLTTNISSTFLGTVTFPNAIKTSAELTDESLALLDICDLPADFRCVAAQTKRTALLLPGVEGTCGGWSFCPSVALFVLRSGRSLPTGGLAGIPPVLPLRLPRPREDPSLSTPGAFLPLSSPVAASRVACLGSMAQQCSSMLLLPCQVRSALGSGFPRHLTGLSVWLCLSLLEKSDSCSVISSCRQTPRWLILPLLL